MHENTPETPVAAPHESSAELGNNVALRGSRSGYPHNARRFELIQKELREGLTPTEAAELRQLEADLDHYLSTLMPLPLEALERVKEIARREGLLPPSAPKE